MKSACMENLPPGAFVPEVLKNEANYERWRILMQHYLESQDLCDVVLKKTPRSGKSEKKWTKKNASALLAIKMSCEPELFEKIKAMTSAKEAWDALAHIQKPPASQDIDEQSRAGPSEIEEPIEGPDDRYLRGLQDQLANTIKNGDVQKVMKFFSRKQLEIAKKYDPSIKDLEMGRNSDNKDALDAARNEMTRLKNKLLTTPGPDNKIPAQVACATAHEDMTRYIYGETPPEILKKDYGFYLLQECITKDMPNIALDLLHIFPNLASHHRFLLGSTPIISTIAQTPSLFRGSAKLVFWKGWIYNRLSVEKKWIKFNPENAPAHQQRGGALTGRLKRLVSKLCKQYNSFVAGALSGRLKRLVSKLWALVPMPLKLLLGPLFRAARVIPEAATTLAYVGVLSTYLIIKEPVSIMKDFFTKQIRAQKSMDWYANEVLRFICERLPGSEFEESGGAVEATFQAIKNGIPEIAEKIIEKTNATISWSSIDDPENSGNMLMCAVAHRQEEVARFLYEFDPSKYPITKTDMILKIDEEGNNMLHLAAKLAPLSQLGCISGAALQLQSELHWFQGVKGIVPWFYNEQKNNDNETPQQVFVREHKDLLKDAEEWMKKTAESSTVVGALIITIMFAAAFSVPGGNDQTSGFPIFLPKKPVPFMVFIISDAISLFAASNSVLMFLGILTSRYAYQDFLKSLPIKLIIGLSSLFISIATMATAFCAALFIMLQDQLWIAILITLLACIPVTFFVWLQFPLLVEIYSSTSRPDIFDLERRSLISKMKAFLQDKIVHKVLCFFSYNLYFSDLRFSGSQTTDQRKLAVPFCFFSYNFYFSDFRFSGSQTTDQRKLAVPGTYRGRKRSIVIV